MVLLGYTPEQIGKLTLRQLALGLEGYQERNDMDQKYQLLLMRTQTELILTILAGKEVDLSSAMPVTPEEEKRAIDGDNERYDEILDYFRNVS